MGTLCDYAGAAPAGPLEDRHRLEHLRHESRHAPKLVVRRTDPVKSNRRDAREVRSVVKQNAP